MLIKKWHLNLLIPLILLVGGILRLLFLVTPYMDSDQATNGLMARHILQGEFPFFFYAQDYCGSIEAYLISTIFFFWGTSRLTLNSAIGLESLFFILLIYFLARTIAVKKTALLAALFTAVPSYYLVFHSVLARSAYIEIPILGVLLFIFTHKIIYRNEQVGRHFFGLGLVCGLGIWTHFLIIFYLPPIFLLLFIKDKWFWGRRTIFFFFLGLILGGLPLWIHNITHPLVTWHYLFDTSGGGEPALTSLKDFFLSRLPEVLGVRDNDTKEFYIPYFSFLLYITYLACFLFLLLSRRKGFLSLFKLKLDQSSGLDLLLLFLFLFPVIFSLSGFASGHTTRYLQPLFAVLPILFAVSTKKIKSFSVALASLFLILHLFSNVYGTMVRLPLISKGQMAKYQQARENDQNLFKFIKEKNIKYVYSPEYWISVRQTFDSREEIIFASPVDDRYPRYTELVDRESHPAFLFAGDNKNFENTLKNIGGTYQKSQVFGYSLYFDFSPPPYRFNELVPTNCNASANFNPSEAINIFDRDLNTRWTSNTPQKPGLVLQVDLGQVVPELGRITLLSGRAEDIPRGLRLEISPDGREWQTVREVSGLWGDLFWSGPHPFYRPGIGRIDITFSPRSGRFFRLTQLGSDPTYYWSVAECFIYQTQPKIKQSSEDLTPWSPYLKRFNIANIYATPWIRSQFPPEWRAKQRALALQKEKEDLVQAVSSPVFVVEKDHSTALTHFLINNFKQPYQEQEIGGQVVCSFPPSSDRFRPLSPKDWHFQTNYNPQKTSLAADGKMSTRWTTNQPQVPGAYFQIDLGKMGKVGRIRVLVGDSVNDFPRGYSIRYSAEGQTWTSLDSIMSPVSLHWTGETLLKGGQDLDLTFPSTPMHHLQIVNTGKDGTYFWSIHEVEIYERQNN